MPNPWDYAEKSGKEHAHQAALFMWANMVHRYGLTAAKYKASYEKAGVAAQYHAAHRDTVPQLKWLHAIHNQGHGDAIRGAKAKAEGVKAGVSDLFLPVPFGTNNADYDKDPGLHDFGGWSFCAGLYLELKVGVNTPSDIQLEFMADMREAGYAADWAVGWQEAAGKILAYLQISC
jgi:hypothetical protein